MRGRLRWKLEPKETGLRAVGAAPRAHNLHDGETEYATVYPNGGGWSRPQDGWFWVAVADGVPLKNTCNSPVATVEEAKAAATAYVKEYLNGAQP